jgi:polysaccharide transporter, PST family
VTLQGRVAQSMCFTVLATIVSGIAQAAALAVLARLLHPAQYGVVAAGLVIVKPVQQILLNGIEQAAVLQTDLGREAVTSLHWLAVALATVSMLAIALVARLLPILPDVRTAAIGLSLILVGPALALAPRVVLRRELAFGRLALAETMATVIGFAAMSVAAALAGFGAMSLVLGSVGQTLVGAAISFALCPGAVAGWRINLAGLRPTLAMALRITRVSFLEIVQAQIAPGFIGGYLGPAPLGKFSQAMAVAALPGQMIAMAMSRVASTSFRIARAEEARLRAACRSLVEIASALTLPICFGVAAASGPLVQVVLGPQWGETAQIMPWLMAGAACNLLGHLLAVMNEAAGRLEEKFRIRLVTIAVLVVTLLIAVRVGLAACAQAYSFAGLVYLVAQARLASRTMGASAAEMLRWIAPGCLCSGAIWIAVFSVQTIWAASSAYVRLSLDVAACAGVTFGLYAALFPRLLRELLQLAGLGERPPPGLESVRP